MPRALISPAFRRKSLLPRPVVTVVASLLAAVVAAAVVKAVKRMDPDREVKVVSANGLQECKKMLMAAKAGKYNGYLLEGMACPGGCIAGAGTVQTVKKAGVALEKMKKEASFEECMDTSFGGELEKLEEL